MSDNVFQLTSGIEVHWTAVGKYIAELDRPLGERACRLCCERENGKPNAKVGLIVAGVCAYGCDFPDDIEAERISYEAFMASDKPKGIEVSSDGEVSMPSKTEDEPAAPTYTRNPHSPFRAGTADDRMLSIVLQNGNDGIKMGELYESALPLFPDKNEKSIRLTVSCFVSRFSRPGTDANFTVVTDIAPKRGRGSNAAERRVAVVFDGFTRPDWALPVGE